MKKKWHHENLSFDAQLQDVASLHCLDIYIFGRLLSALRRVGSEPGNQFVATTYTFDAHNYCGWVEVSVGRIYLGPTGLYCKFIGGM